MNDSKPTATASLSIAEIIAKSPDPVAAIKDLGTMLARSQTLGPTDKPETGAVAVMLCATEGITIGEFMRTYQLSFGRFERRIDAALAEFKRRGGKLEWLADGSDGQQARAKFTLGDESVEASCTVAEAQKAGWTRNTKWSSEPKTMLQARVKKRGVLALCPDIFYGENEEEQATASVAIEPGKAAAAVATAQSAPARSTTPAAPPAPTAPPPPAPAPTTAPANESVRDPAAPRPPLSEQLQTDLLAIIGAENVGHAQTWLTKVGWLPAGDSIDQLPEKFAKQIIAKADAFKTKLADFIAKGGAK